ncbi:MAG: PBP1A family penicillin-binding protein [Ardenticatenaceae bacterium]|nr:PBP1A family penicillin-binding protein [Ardenticatenaceae bacterium]
MDDEQDTQKPIVNPEDDTPVGKRPLPPPPPPPPDEAETVSLFDLMDAADDPTITLSSMTDEAAKAAAQTGPTVPPPLAAPELTPRERPPMYDMDATQVRPDLAIPGNRQTTQPAQPPTTQAPPQQPPTRQQYPAQPPPPAQSTARPQPPAQPARQQPVYPQQPVRQAAPARQVGPARQAAPHSARVAMPPQEVAPRPMRRAKRNWGGCLIRGLVVLVAAFVVGFMLLVAGSAFAYRAIAADLPEIGDLEAKASSFETARIYDRNGNELSTLVDPETGNRVRVTLPEIAQDLIDATIATEDSRFYQNPGFDPIGITRAIVQAAQEGEAVSGASTITQQLVRALVLSEEERTERTLRRKIREIILAAEMWQKYDKDTILELYLNEIYYGNRAYGIEAAAQTYFNKSAKDLTLAEASLLAGLPQAPAFWDPYTNPDGALIRQTQVLNLMVAEGYATYQRALAAQNETAVFIYNLTPPAAPQVRHPHFVYTVLQQAEALLGAQSIYRGGLRIYTTLDPEAQRLAETAVTDARATINNAGANNAAMVVVQPATGEILALVGSADFFNEAISGQVNMALAPRQPGSSIKPLVYLSAFENGWTPATLIWDVPTSFPDGANPPYQPKNYDDTFHGPLRVRPSLGNSYNVPAVKALEFVGVCNFINNVQKVGLTSLKDEGCATGGQPANYGLALALGGGEISPLEMAGAFGALANQGRYVKPFTISRIENRLGEIRYEHTQPGAEAQVVRPEHAYLLSDILSDNSARQPAFGLNNPLVIAGHRVAAKTGTSGSSRLDVRDNWTIGYTPEVVTAVWVGNTDNTPMGQNASAVEVAAPIWNRFMSQYLAGRAPVDFPRPGGVIDVEICADSGARPGPGCVNRTVERFAQDQPPLNADADFSRVLPIDLWTGLQANERCPESVQEATFFDILVSGQPAVWERERFVAKQWVETTGGGQAWARARNIAIPLTLPPEQACDENTPRPEITINQPTERAEVSGIFDIWGTVKAPNFNGYEVEYGLGENPGGWGLIQERRPTPVENGVLATWDTANTNAAGPVTIRILLFGPDNPYNPEAGPTVVEERVTVLILEPTGTPTATPTDTPTPTNTPTPTETPTITTTPTETPSPTPTGTAVPPTETPTLPPPTGEPSPTPTQEAPPPVETVKP